MGEAVAPRPVNLICAMLAARSEWLDRARELLVGRFGPVDLAGETEPFDYTDYYEPQMGPGLLRRMLSFRDLIDPGETAAVKLETNRIEEELARTIAGGPPRPVNLDPGYVDAARLVLATTKDHTHRLYLRDGIYAEVTLRWHRGRFEPCEWTYPDYRTESYREFFRKVRELYRAKPGGPDSGPAERSIGGEPEP